MSVYIKGRKPPNSCDDCWVSDCPNDEHIDGYRMMGRPTYCPLMLVPPHGDLIDKKTVSENLASVLNKKDPPFSYPNWNDAIVAMLTAPIIIPADKEH